MKKIAVLAVLAVCLVFVLAAIAPLWAAGDLKMPQANIVPPGTDIPADIRAFSGRWKGRWSSWACPPDHGLDAILVVEEITPTTVRCQYSWGNDKGWGIYPGCVTIKAAKFERREEKVYLVWYSRQGVPFYFWVEGGKMKGKKGALTSQYEVMMERF